MALWSFRSRAWVISLATHVVVLVLLVRVLDRRPVPAEPPPSSLVYVDLVPSPPAAIGVPDGAGEPMAQEPEPVPATPPPIPPTVQPKRAIAPPKPRPVAAAAPATRPAAPA